MCTYMSSNRKTSFSFSGKVIQGLSSWLPTSQQVISIDKYVYKRLTNTAKVSALTFYTFQWYHFPGVTVLFNIIVPINFPQNTLPGQPIIYWGHVQTHVEGEIFPLAAIVPFAKMWETFESRQKWTIGAETRQTRWTAERWLIARLLISFSFFVTKYRKRTSTDEWCHKLQS